MELADVTQARTPVQVIVLLGAPTAVLTRLGLRAVKGQEPRSGPEGGSKGGGLGWIGEQGSRAQRRGCEQRSGYEAVGRRARSGDQRMDA